MNHSFTLDIIVLAVIAVVLFVRLRKVLGERQDGDLPAIDTTALLGGRPAEKTIEKEAAPATSWTQAMPDYKTVANATTHNRLLPIAAMDPSFQPQDFLQGARRAYELVVMAFARGELPTLENLLTPELYETFKADIEDRKNNGQTRDLVLHNMTSALISDAELNGTIALVSVDFTTEQSITLRERDGQIADDLDGTRHVLHERWTFWNDLKDNETLWRLVETDTIDD